MGRAPSMTGLRVLEAVVRNGSLSAAARELCVTPAAISHRLRSLEAQGGGSLVERIGGRFVATDLGQRVLSALRDAFERIRSADAILSGTGAPALRIVASYSFTVLWLAPRLCQFEQHHPGVQLVLEPSHSPLEKGHSDVSILHAASPPRTTGWVRLFADRCAVVGRATHPLFAQPCVGPADAPTGRVVTVAHGNGPAYGEFSWQQWAEALALPPPGKVMGPTVTAEHLAVDLVLAEDALALVSLVNASRLIGQGQLRALRGSDVATGCSYWAQSTVRSGRAGTLAAAFINWMRHELAEFDLAAQPPPQSHRDAASTVRPTVTPAWVGRAKEGSE